MAVPCPLCPESFIPQFTSTVKRSLSDRAPLINKCPLFIPESSIDI